MKDQLQELNEPLAARMQETVTSRPAKTLRQHMQHQQVEKILAISGIPKQQSHVNAGRLSL